MTSEGGDLLYSEDGRAYIDFFAGAGALNYGHNNDYIKDRVLDYLTSDRIMHGLDMYTMAKREFFKSFSERILEPKKLNYKLQVCGPTGTSAVEADLKLARKAKKRTGIRIHGRLPRHVDRQPVGDKLQVHEGRGGASSGRSYVHAAPERGFRRNGYARLYREYPD
ncbi:hypothetical protein LWE69_01290 [Paenibacillus sp. UKAQ_18]|nr:hypothetical protein [Paenibacillus sp. UKAQ_18]